MYDKKTNCGENNSAQSDRLISSCALFANLNWIFLFLFFFLSDFWMRPT